MQFLNLIFILISWLTTSNLMSGSALSVFNERVWQYSVLISQGLKAIVDWLRLHDSTSFYVTLILKTFIEIAYFLFIMLLLLIYIGNAMYMLHLNVDPAIENSDIIIPIFGNSLIDSTLNQFNLMIGDYNTDGFTKHVNPALCYALFIITVIISQITFLNMLIAIMADTFEKVIE